MASMRCTIAFARFLLPPIQGASGSAGGTGVSVSAGMASSIFSGMDKRAISHDHGPASCEVAGRPALGRFWSWEV